MSFSLGQHSIDKLVGVHPDLVAVVKTAISQSDTDFSVIYGLRTVEEEAAMVAKGASQTMHSRHLANQDGFACAVDVAAFVDGQIVWEPVSLYQSIADAFKAAAAQLNVPLEWGGDWKTLKDYGHFQLTWAAYP